MFTSPMNKSKPNTASAPPQNPQIPTVSLSLSSLHRISLILAIHFSPPPPPPPQRAQRGDVDCAGYFVGFA
ncbi:hypothetical protein AKJ16_DCAP03612 [Drosera capensis]